VQVRARLSGGREYVLLPPEGQTPEAWLDALTTPRPGQREVPARPIGWLSAAPAEPGQRRVLVRGTDIVELSLVDAD
jgi:hypothetical protein